MPASDRLVRVHDIGRFSARGAKVARCVGLLVADCACALGQECELALRRGGVGVGAAELPEGAGPPAAPAGHADEGEDEEEELGEGVPDELAVEVFEADFAGDDVGGGDEAHAEDAVEDGAVVAGEEEGGEGDEGDGGVGG